MLYVGLALTVPGSLSLEGLGLWLALRPGPAVAGGPGVSLLAPALIAAGSLACLVGVALMIAPVLRERRRAAVPVAQPARREAADGEGAGERAAALAHARKMEALGVLAGGVAHDFNNLLHVISNSLEILQRQEPHAESMRYLEMIRRSADRAAALTRQLLAFSRRQPLDPRPLDPNELVTQVAELLRHSLGEQIIIRTVLGCEIWKVAADAGELETALINLAINARDAMSPAGLLTIETANVPLDAPAVMIAVSDTGAGMAPEVAARACEPFFTTKEPGQGTGLGLSQVARFAHEAGGELRIFSAPGRGTTVRLYLPKAGPSAGPRSGTAWSIKDATHGDPLAAAAGSER